MSESGPSAAAAPSAAEKTPLDVKLFYSFIAVLVVGMIAVLGLWRPNDAGKLTSSSRDPARQLGAFAFTNQAGQLITQAEVQNKLLVVNFVHTSCSISCLQVNERMSEVQRLTADQENVQLLSFTVDPGTDTPPVLAKFGEKFGADATRWSLLTGKKSELYALIESSFLKRDTLHPASPMPGGFQDTDRIAVVDRDGKVRRYFDGLRPETPAAIVRCLNELRNESK